MTDEQIYLLIIIGIVAIVTLYLEWRLRKIGVRKKITAASEKKDQAYNSLMTTKAIRERLKRERISTIKGDYAIERAQDLLDSRNYEGCISACATAREELLKAKQSGVSAIAMASDTPVEATTSESPAQHVTAVRKIKEGEETDTLKLQARFELNIAKDELAQFSGDGKKKAAASKLIDEAESLLNTGDYQKSLSSAYRAKKLLSKDEDEEETELATLAEPQKILQTETAIKDSCRKCGETLDEDDAFCGACGASAKPSTCKSCGAELKDKDTFCRKCGQKVQ